MRVKRGLLLMAVGAAAMPLAAMANPDSYAALQLSQVEYSESGAPDLEPTALTARLGANLSPNFGLELRVGTGLSDDSITVGPEKLTLELDNAISAYARVMAPMGERFTAYAMVGLTRSKITAKFRDATGSFSMSDSETDLSYGVGGELLLNVNTFVSVEYARLLDGDDYELDALSIGIGFRF